MIKTIQKNGYRLEKFNDGYAIYKSDFRNQEEQNLKESGPSDPIKIFSNYKKALYFFENIQSKI